MSTDHFTLLANRIRELEKDQEQQVLVAGISASVADNLWGMNVEAWMKAGMAEGKAEELIQGFNQGSRHYAEKMVTSLGRVHILTHEENVWGDEAVVIWKGRPYREPEFSAMNKVRVASPETHDYAGFVMDTKWHAPEGCYHHRISVDPIDVDGEFENWVPEGCLTRIS